MSAVFVTGTDTNIGKTITCSLLLSALVQSTKSAGYFKPIQTGTDSDTATVTALTGSSSLAPVYSFPEPIAPSRAAKFHDTEIQIDEIQKVWATRSSASWVVEGAGGIMVPINSKHTIRDLVKALDLNLLVVASTRLGTINHTLLTLEAARSAAIPVLGVILMGEEDPGLADQLKEFSGVPILAQIPVLSVTPSGIAQAACRYFPKPLLERIFT